MNTNNNYKENNLPTTRIQYVDGLCGSGKTWGMGAYIKGESLSNDNKYMIITPSKILANQINEQLIVELSRVNYPGQTDDNYPGRL